MSTDLEMLNNLKYSNEIVEQLSLSEQQLYALNADCFHEMLPERVAKGDRRHRGGVSRNGSPIRSGGCASVSAMRSPAFMSCLDAVQAGFLASIGVAYKDIETLIGLPGGEIVRWLEEYALECTLEPSTDV